MEPWKELVGTAAGFCTTIAFVPQVIKIWKQGGRDLSWGMLALFLTGVLLWFSYGILLHSPSIIVANGATALLIILACALKLWTAERPQKPAPLPTTIPEQR
jgi:MtN3 and saliva related transmembrane protein